MTPFYDFLLVCHNSSVLSSAVSDMFPPDYQLRTDVTAMNDSEQSFSSNATVAMTAHI